MSALPTGSTVARARYWLKAAIKVAGLVFVVVAGAHVGYLVIDLIIGLFSGSQFFDLLGRLWIAYGTELVRFMGGLALFFFAGPIARTVLPLAPSGCARCGYSRAGLLKTDPCPECGAHNGPQAVSEQRARRASEGGPPAA